MNHITVFWRTIAFVPILSLICSLFWGEAVLMGWAHNWGFVTLLVFFVALKPYWTKLSKSFLSLTAIFFIGSLWIGFYTWPSMESPWLFSTYTLMAMWCGWLAYLTGLTNEDTPPLHHGKWIALGLLPLLALPFYSQIFFETRTAIEWAYKVVGFGNVRAMGHFLALGVVAHTAWMWMQKPHKAWWFLTIVLWTLLFWSGSRTGLFGSVVGLTLAAGISRTHWRLIAAAAATMIVGATLSLFLFEPTHHYGGLKRVSIIAQAFEDNALSNTTTTTSTTETAQNAPTKNFSQSAGRASSGRTDLWRQGWAATLENPLTGNGLGNWKEDTHNSSEKNFFHLHNIVLDTLHSFGLIIGGALLALFGFASLRGLVDAWRLKQHSTFYVAMFVCVSCMALLDAILWMPVTTAIAGICLGSLRHKASKIANT
jgi:O-antigen ligase